MKLPFGISIPFLSKQGSAPKLSYINQGRSGYVVYKDKQSELSFYFEFGGGDCIAIIDIPAPKDWQSKTGRSLDERETIVTFMAEQARKDQAPKGSYRLSERSIELLSTK